MTKIKARIEYINHKFMEFNSVLNLADKMNALTCNGLNPGLPRNDLNRANSSTYNCNISNSSQNSFNHSTNKATNSSPPVNGFNNDTTTNKVMRPLVSGNNPSSLSNSVNSLSSVINSPFGKSDKPTSSQNASKDITTTNLNSVIPNGVHPGSSLQINLNDIVSKANSVGLNNKLRPPSQNGLNNINNVNLINKLNSILSNRVNPDATSQTDAIANTNLINGINSNCKIKHSTNCGGDGINNDSNCNKIADTKSKNGIIFYEANDDFVLNDLDKEIEKAIHQVEEPINQA